MPHGVEIYDCVCDTYQSIFNTKPLVCYTSIGYNDAIKNNIIDKSINISDKIYDLNVHELGEYSRAYKTFLYKK